MDCGEEGEQEGFVLFSRCWFAGYVGGPDTKRCFFAFYGMGFAVWLFMLFMQRKLAA